MGAVNAGELLGGRYELMRLLGQGGMGEVWIAHDCRLHRDVAVKVITSDSRGDPSRPARLRREARAVANLNHPGITVVHDSGEHNGAPFFVMELLHGEDFAKLLDAHPDGLPAERAIKLMKQVASALAYAHANNVVHRDIKPSNVGP